VTLCNNEFLSLGEIHIVDILGEEGLGHQAVDPEQPAYVVADLRGVIKNEQTVKI
jgi:hypothetical protein